MSPDQKDSCSLGLIFFWGGGAGWSGGHDVKNRIKTTKFGPRPSKLRGKFWWSYVGKINFTNRTICSGSDWWLCWRKRRQWQIDECSLIHEKRILMIPVEVGAETSSNTRAPSPRRNQFGELLPTTTTFTFNYSNLERGELMSLASWWEAVVCRD